MLLKQQQKAASQQQQQQRQQQQQLHGPRLPNRSRGGLYPALTADIQLVKDIAIQQLSLYEHLLAIWPVSSSSLSSLSSSKELGEAALPAVQLALLLLEAYSNDP
jgi:hypothetical protein